MQSKGENIPPVYALNNCYLLHDLTWYQGIKMHAQTVFGKQCTYLCLQMSVYAFILGLSTCYLRNTVFIIKSEVWLFAVGRWAQISRSDISILLWGFITLSCQNSTQHSHLTHFVCRNLSCLSASWSTFIYLLMLPVKSLDIHFKQHKALKVKYSRVPSSIIKNLTVSVPDTGSDQQRGFICGKARLTSTLMSMMLCLWSLDYVIQNQYMDFSAVENKRRYLHFSTYRSKAYMFGMRVSKYIFFCVNYRFQLSKSTSFITSTWELIPWCFKAFWVDSWLSVCPQMMWMWNDEVDLICLSFW